MKEAVYIDSGMKNEYKKESIEKFYLCVKEKSADKNSWLIDELILVSRIVPCYLLKFGHALYTNFRMNN